MAMRWFSTFLVFLLTAVVFIGCSNSNQTANNPSDGNTSEKTNENTVTDAKPASIKIFSYALPEPYFPDSELEKTIEEKSNIRVDYELVPTSDYDLKLNVKIAGNDLADLVNISYPNTPQYVQLVNQGLFIPIDDYLESMPKLKGAFSKEIWDSIRNKTDGKIYGVPRCCGLRAQTINYRPDWLEKLQLTPPKTLDDFVNMLEKFRDSDLDGNKKNDTIPLSFDNMKISSAVDFLPLFGASSGWVPSKADPNKLEYGLIQDGARDAFIFLRELRQQKLLDPDYGIGKKKGTDKYIEGNVGAFVSKVNFYRVPILAGVPTKILPPIENNGNTWSFQALHNQIQFIMAIPKGSKNAEAALKYLEFMLTDGVDYFQYGIENKTYEVVDNRKIPFAADKISNGVGQPNSLVLVHPQALLESPQIWEKFVPVDEAKYMSEMNNLYVSHTVYDHRDPAVIVPTLSEKQEQLTAILEEGMAKIILDDKVDPIAVWKETVEKWKKEGGDKATAELNELQQDKSTPNHVSVVQ